MVVWDDSVVKVVGLKTSRVCGDIWATRMLSLLSLSGGEKEEEEREIETRGVTSRSKASEGAMPHYPASEPCDPGRTFKWLAKGRGPLELQRVPGSLRTRGNSSPRVSPHTADKPGGPPYRRLILHVREQAPFHRSTPSSQRLYRNSLKARNVRCTIIASRACFSGVVADQSALRSPSSKHFHSCFGSARGKLQQR